MKNQKDRILENIRQIMRSKGIKLETVSNAIGISKGEFSKILNDKRKGYEQYLAKIAEVLEVSLQELIYLPDTPQTETECISMELHKKTMDVCNAAHQQAITAYNQTIKLLETNLANLQAKYEKLKNKLLSAEKKLEKYEKGN